MGWKCCVPSCRSGYDKPPPNEPKLSFYRFPHEPGLKHNWIRNISRAE